MYIERNSNMAELLRLTMNAEKVATDARRAASGAEERAEQLSSFYRTIRDELKTIEAKRTLKMRLTQRERAVWILYGKADRN